MDSRDAGESDEVDALTPPPSLFSEMALAAAAGGTEGFLDGSQHGPVTSTLMGAGKAALAALTAFWVRRALERHLRNGDAGLYLGMRQDILKALLPRQSRFERQVDGLFTRLQRLAGNGSLAQHHQHKLRDLGLAWAENTHCVFADTDERFTDFLYSASDLGHRLIRLVREPVAEPSGVATK